MKQNTVMSTDTRTFSKLRGRENYDLWKISAKSYMVIKGFWSCILVEPTATKTDEIERDLKALSELTLLLDETIYSYISNTNTAKEAWTKLEKAFEDSGLSRKVELLKQLVKLTLDECDNVQDYVSRMVTTCSKVGKAGLVIDDEILASLMLAGLPDEYKSLVMAIENTTTKLTSEDVKTLLLQEVRINPNTNNGGAFVAKSNNNGSFKYNCRSCGKIGHMAKDCLDRQSEYEFSGRNRENGGRDRENGGRYRENSDREHGGRNRENGDRENGGRKVGTGFWTGGF